MTSRIPPGGHFLWFHKVGFVIITDMREKLSSEEGQRLYGLRKIEDEPVFGNLKAHLKFLRLSVRGIAKVRNEVGIALLAYNIMKWQRAISLYSFLSAMISEYIQKMHRQILILEICRCIFS